jgi:hypothetical protein
LFRNDRRQQAKTLRKHLSKALLSFMNKQHLLRIIFVLLALFSCACLAETPPAPESETGIEGVISVGPIHGGPSRVGVPDSRPFANAAFVVENENGPVTSFTTDDQGRFRITLAPGHYVVSMKDRKPRLGRYGPFGVDVVAGKMTKVQWNCDTGMR